jgi:hypothetical protein
VPHLLGPRLPPQEDVDGVRTDSDDLCNSVRGSKLEELRDSWEIL